MGSMRQSHEADEAGCLQAPWHQREKRNWTKFKLHFQFLHILADKYFTLDLSQEAGLEVKSYTVQCLPQKLTRCPGQEMLHQSAWESAGWLKHMGTNYYPRNDCLYFGIGRHFKNGNAHGALNRISLPKVWRSDSEDLQPPSPRRLLLSSYFWNSTLLARLTPKHKAKISCTWNRLLSHDKQKYGN